MLDGYGTECYSATLSVLEDVQPVAYRVLVVTLVDDLSVLNDLVHVTTFR